MEGKAEELRGEIKSLLKKNHKIKPYIPKDEYQVLREMKKGNTRMVLTVDKGVSMVVWIGKIIQPSQKCYYINKTTRSFRQIPQTSIRIS